MARRRRRRKDGYYGFLLLAGGLLVAGTLLQWLGQFVAAHAVAVSVAAVLAAGFLAGAVALVVRARREQALRQAELDRNVAVTDGMTGPQFEQYVARLLRRDGLRQVEVCGGSGDLGADVTAYTPDGRRVVVQCKRYTKSVGDPHVQKFNGTAWQIHGADVALLVTTGRPTDNARRLAQRCGIVLVDRGALAVWATDSVPPIPGWTASTRPTAGSAGPGQLPFAPGTP